MLIIRESGKFLHSMLEGRKTEERFELLCRRLGWTVRHSLPKEDIFDHVDFEIRRVVDNNSMEEIKIDVKGMKRVSRHDFNVQEDYVWLELKGVNNSGWLHGKADAIAFEQKSGFIIFSRVDLLTYITAKMKDKLTVNCPTDALYAFYSRKNRDDLLTLVPMVDLQNHLPHYTFIYS